MPLELQLIRASEFIRLNAEGHFDLETSKMALANLAWACHRRGIERAMIDLRGIRVQLTPMLSRDDLVALVNTFHCLGFSKRQRLALLYDTDPHGRARLFAFITIMRGWKVRSFTKFEEAMMWLSENFKQDRRTTNPVQVPIKNRPALARK